MLPVLNGFKISLENVKVFNTLKFQNSFNNSNDSIMNKTYVILLWNASKIHHFVKYFSFSLCQNRKVFNAEKAKVLPVILI